jgi:hypothetical protein
VTIAYHRKVRVASWPPPYPGMCVEIDCIDYIVESVDPDPDAVLKVEDRMREVAWELDRDTYEPMPIIASPQSVLVSVRPATEDEVLAWADNEASEFQESRRIQRNQSIWRKAARLLTGQAS